MKTPLNTLSDEKAKRELKQFAILGLACSAVSLVTLWFLAIVGLASSLRALLLVQHKGNTGQPKTAVYRNTAFAGLVLAVVGSVFYFTGH